jgi:Pvc16 N-terminal domain
MATPALAPLGVLDLSAVTQVLVTLVENARDDSPLWLTLGQTKPTFTISVSGAMPQAVRHDGDDCQLNIYLFHVTQDKFQRNSPVMGPRSVTIPSQPLSLDLFYLVTAFSKGKTGWTQEQQAMSIALQAFHQTPFVRTSITVPNNPAVNVPEEFSLTMEIETSDQFSGLWQAFSAPFRMSVIYKVSVVFMTPPLPAANAPKVQKFTLATSSALLPLADSGQVISTMRTVTFATSKSKVGAEDVISTDYSPAVVAPSQRFLLHGGGFTKATAQRVYLLFADGSEREVTWKAPDPDALHPLQSDSRYTLDLPSTIGTAATDSPPPGVYQLCVGSDKAAGDASDNRSNATPFSVAPLISGTPALPNPPMLSDVAGLFTVNGVGFTTGKTDVLLDSLKLKNVALNPAAGEFAVAGTETQITFRAPAVHPTGPHMVRVRVNGVEAPPSWWVSL